MCIEWVKVFLRSLHVFFSFTSRTNRSFAATGNHQFEEYNTNTFRLYCWKYCHTLILLRVTKAINKYLLWSCEDPGNWIELLFFICSPYNVTAKKRGSRKIHLVQWCVIHLFEKQQVFTAHWPQSDPRSRSWTAINKIPADPTHTHGRGKWFWSRGTEIIIIMIRIIMERCWADAVACWVVIPASRNLSGVST